MEALDKTSIKCGGLIELTSNYTMAFKAIVLFALLAVAFAEDLHLGFRMKFPLSPQVVGGSDAPEHGYPHIVSLQWGTNKNNVQHFCAGSILSSQVIITAAHCVKAVPNFGLFLVKAGKHNIKRTEPDEQVVEVASSVVHENYKGGVGPYDIALLKLKTPLKLTKNVKAIKLPQPESEPSGDAYISGWGSTSRDRYPLMPDILQHAQLDYVDLKTCDDAVKRLTGSSPVHETNVCTGPLNGARSACSGDSGGPLISYTQNEPELTGIVSWGIVPCGSNGAPSVYTKVSKYNDWIKKHSY